MRLIFFAANCLISWPRYPLHNCGSSQRSHQHSLSCYGLVVAYCGRGGSSVGVSAEYPRNKSSFTELVCYRRYVAELPAVCYLHLSDDFAVCMKLCMELLR